MALCPPPRAGSSTVEFGPFVLDRTGGTLTREGAVVPLRPKAWDVLVLLVGRAGELLSADAILEDAWRGVTVTPKTLANVIAELRHALGDDLERPIYIETVHRRGYRFIASLGPSARSAPFRPALIGRERELERLEQAWADACADGPRVVFVAGEPGIGKTSLIQEFLRRIGAPDTAGRRSLWSATGQCVERHGAHEAYMPLLEAIASLASGPHADSVREHLRRFAPNWLLQLPWLIEPELAPPAAPTVPGFGEARMLREALQFFQSLGEQRPTVLVLEDLHWADPETIDFLAAAHRRQQPIPLLLVCTYRLTEARLHRHPIVKVADDARATGSVFLSLENFSASEIRAYLEQRFPGRTLDRGLASVIEDHSGGNPLFVRATVDHLLECGQLAVTADSCHLSPAATSASIDLPGTVRGMIGAQIELLPDDIRGLLEAAAAAGQTFSVTEVAAARRDEPESVETALDRLAVDSRFVVRASIPPAAAAATPREAFSFPHSLYQRVLYDRLGAPDRRRYHQRIGEALERIGEATHRPAVLADHFDRSGDHFRAAHYLEICAAAAARRLADRERLNYLERTLAHIENLPEGPDRTAAELRVQIGIGEAVSALDGPQNRRVASVVRRALELCNEVDDPRSLFIALHGLWLYNILHGDLRATRALIDRTDRLAEGERRTELTLLAELQRGAALAFDGAAGDGCTHLERAEALLDRIDEDWMPVTLPDVQVEIVGALAWVLWLVGRADEALQHAKQAYERTIERRDVVSTVVASVFLCNVHLLRGEPEKTLGVARELRVMGDEFALDLARMTGTMLEASALVEMLEIDKAFALLTSAGVAESDPGLQQIVRTYFITRLAHACGRMGVPQQGLMLLSEADARIERSGSPISEPEVWRMRGDLALQAGDEAVRATKLAGAEGLDAVTYAERCLRRAVEIARQQQTPGFELRAATSLARLLQQTGRAAEARSELEPVLATFSQGFATADLLEARDVLDGLTN